MFSPRHVTACLFCLLLAPLTACSTSDDLSGAAEPGIDMAADPAAEKGAPQAVEGPVASLEGYEGELDPWGESDGKLTVARSGYAMFGVAEPEAVLVLDDALAKDVDAVIEAFAESKEGQQGSGQSGTRIFLAEGFASEGGLGTTRFTEVGTATGVNP